MGAVTILVLALGILSLTAYAWLAREDNAQLRQRVEGLGHMVDMLKRDKAVLEEECHVLLQQKGLTHTGAKAQDAVRRFSGAQLRRMSDRENAHVPEPTQAEKLRGYGPEMLRAINGAEANERAING
jgi:hypothetical protein